MELTLYQIDAFANNVFEGNPAAICPLNEWLSDELMQKIATENNLSETAYIIPDENGYKIRWFTPAHEVKLCGHATLAAAYVIFNIIGFKEKNISFSSKSGILTVEKDEEWLEMNFPSQEPKYCETPEIIERAFNKKPLECLRNEDYIVVFENEEDIINAKPDLSLLEKLDLRGIAITSSSKKYDFISRFFAPKYGINEDPVTGSAFTQLIPYWAKKFNKKEMLAKQVSKRGGEVRCEPIEYMVGKIKI